MAARLGGSGYSDFDSKDNSGYDGVPHVGASMGTAVEYDDASKNSRFTHGISTRHREK